MQPSPHQPRSHENYIDPRPAQASIQQMQPLRLPYAGQNFATLAPYGAPSLYRPTSNPAPISVNHAQGAMGGGVGESHCLPAPYPHYSPASFRPQSQQRQPSSAMIGVPLSSHSSVSSFSLGPNSHGLSLPNRSGPLSTMLGSSTSYYRDPGPPGTASQGYRQQPLPSQQQMPFQQNVFQQNVFQQHMQREQQGIQQTFLSGTPSLFWQQQQQQQQQHLRKAFAAQSGGVTSATVGVPNIPVQGFRSMTPSTYNYRQTGPPVGSPLPPRGPLLTPGSGTVSNAQANFYGKTSVSSSSPGALAPNRTGSTAVDLHTSAPFPTVLSQTPLYGERGALTYPQNPQLANAAAETAGTGHMFSVSLSLPPYIPLPVPFKRRCYVVENRCNVKHNIFRHCFRRHSDPYVLDSEEDVLLALGPRRTHCKELGSVYILGRSHCHDAGMIIAVGESPKVCQDYVVWAQKKLRIRPDIEGTSKVLNIIGRVDLPNGSLAIDLLDLRIFISAAFPHWKVVFHPGICSILAIRRREHRKANDANDRQGEIEKELCEGERPVKKRHVDEDTATSETTFKRESTEVAEEVTMQQHQVQNLSKVADGLDLSTTEISKDIPLSSSTPLGIITRWMFETENDEAQKEATSTTEARTSWLDCTLLVAPQHVVVHRATTDAQLEQAWAYFFPLVRRFLYRLEKQPRRTETVPGVRDTDASMKEGGQLPECLPTGTPPSNVGEVFYSPQTTGTLSQTTQPSPSVSNVANQCPATNANPTLFASGDSTPTNRGENGKSVMVSQASKSVSSVSGPYNIHSRNAFHAQGNCATLPQGPPSFLYGQSSQLQSGPPSSLANASAFKHPADSATNGVN